MKNSKMYRILIEDETGLHQAILKNTEESRDVIHNLKNILKTTDVTDYIFIEDLKNQNSAVVSVHGNGEKLASMYDLLTKFFITKDPGIMMRVISAWEKGKGAAND